MIAFPNINPIALQIGPLAIHWYAIAYVAGILLGYEYVGWLNKKRHFFSDAARNDLIFYAVLGVLLGGRTGYVLFYNLPYYLAHPGDILHIWQGGMSFHGGLLGVLVAFCLFARKYHLPWLGVMDYLACATPIGLFFGRIANFVNGELFGRITDSPLGMVFPRGGPMPRHPSQLYEAGLEGLVLFLILFFIARSGEVFAWRGRAAGIFTLGYGIARFSIEFFREPDAQLGFLFGGVTMGQLLCLPMIAIGGWLILSAKHRAA